MKKSRVRCANRKSGEADKNPISVDETFPPWDTAVLIANHGWSAKIPGTFLFTQRLYPMSSLSEAQFEADLPTNLSETDADADLFKKAQVGDRSAFGQIVLRHQDRLFNAIVRLVGDHDEARELTQETFLRAMANLENFRGEARPYTWLFRIGMNLAISQLRKFPRRRTFSLDAPGHNGDHLRPPDQAASLLDRTADRQTRTPLAELEQRERDEQVVAAIGRLDMHTRALLVMRDIEGFDYQQMAEILELPLGTLKSRLFRARLALKDELEKYMKE
jgi:RNA polymerase sigma-70 factor, ECF subfamily